MNSTKTIINIVLSIAVLLPASCTIKGYDTAKLSADFQTEGFLDPDHFQIVVKAYPDRGKKGLISKRESALENAEEQLNDTIIERLSDYYLTFYAKKMGIRDKTSIIFQTEKMAELKKVMSRYLNHGYRAFEYYNRDSSAVLVYRIFKSGLRTEIESIKISFKLDTQN